MLYNLGCIRDFVNNSTVELNNPTNPADCKTDNIIFALNEKWSRVEHIGRTVEVSHAEKFIAVVQADATVSVMREIFYDMN